MARKLCLDKSKLLPTEVDPFFCIPLVSQKLLERTLSHQKSTLKVKDGNQELVCYSPLPHYILVWTQFLHMLFLYPLS